MYSKMSNVRYLVENSLSEHPEITKELSKAIDGIARALQSAGKRTAVDDASAEKFATSAMKRSEAEQRLASRRKTNEALEYEFMVVESMLLFNTSMPSDLVIEGEFDGNQYTVEFTKESGAPVVYASKMENSAIARQLTNELLECLMNPNEEVLIRADEVVSEAVEMMNEGKQLDESVLGFMKGAASAVGRKAKNLATGAANQVRDVIDSGKSEYHRSKMNKANKQMATNREQLDINKTDVKLHASKFNDILRRSAKIDGVKFNTNDLRNLVTSRVKDPELANQVMSAIKGG